jgi:hypothetical protein
MALLVAEIVLLVAKLGWMGAALVVVAFLAATVNFLAPSGSCSIASHGSELVPLSEPTNSTHGGLASNLMVGLPTIVCPARVNLLSH